MYLTESDRNMELIRQSYVDTIYELNQELLSLKNHSSITKEDSDTQTTDENSINGLLISFIFISLIFPFL